MTSDCKLRIEKGKPEMMNWKTDFSRSFEECGKLRGPAYGVYNFFIGMAMLPASLLMGLIWKTMGTKWAFSFGATMALIAALLAIILMGKPHTQNAQSQNPYDWSP